MDTGSRYASHRQYKYLNNVLPRQNGEGISDELNAALADGWDVESHEVKISHSSVTHAWTLYKWVYRVDEWQDPVTDDEDTPITNKDAEEKNLNIVLDAIRSAAPEESDDLATANIVPIPEAVPTTEPDIFVGAGDFTPTALLDETGITFDQPDDEDEDIIIADDQPTEPHPTHHITYLTAFDTPTVVPTFREAMEAHARGELTIEDVIGIAEDKAQQDARLAWDSFNMQPTNIVRFPELKAAG